MQLSKNQLRNKHVPFHKNNACCEKNTAYIRYGNYWKKNAILNRLLSTSSWKNFTFLKTTFFSPTAEYYGVSAQYSFGVLWASWASGKKKRVPGTNSGTGSNGFRGSVRLQGSLELVPMGFEVWMGSDSRVQVPGAGSNGFRGLDGFWFQGSEVPGKFQWVLRFGWALIPGFRGARNRFQWFGWVLIPGFRGARSRFQWVSRFGWVLIPGFRFQ